MNKLKEKRFYFILIFGMLLSFILDTIFDLKINLYVFYVGVVIGALFFNNERV